jgi:hypothetical protein
MAVQVADRRSNRQARNQWLAGSLALALVLAALQLFSPAGVLAQDVEVPYETAAGSTADQSDPSAVAATTWYVDGSSGSDNNRCTSAGAPCRTIQAAIDSSASGDTILVAGSANGIVYTFAAASACTNGLGANAVACVNDKQLTIRGGYPQGSFASYAPAQNVSIIDGQTRNRGVVAVGFASTTGTVLDIGGFTVRNGYGTGIGKRAGTGSYYGFGGGMLVEFAGAVTLRDMTFESNVVAGGDRRSGEGGAGAGGGASFHTTTATLENVRFTKNVAQGGSGVDRGGYGHGGALFTYNTTLTGNGLWFEGNVARAGNANNSGLAGDGQRADGQGGGVCFSTGSKVTLNNVTALNNQAIGGNAATYAGGAFGGGLYAEAATVNINDAHIRGNLAQGGNAANGWMGSGGGIMAFNSTLNVNRALILANTAQGGNGSNGQYGGPNGGGITLSASDLASRFTLVNSVVAGNKAAHGQGAVLGGGGGGMWIQATEATIDHATITHNQLGDGTGLSGQGVLLYNPPNRAQPT